VVSLPGLEDLGDVLHTNNTFEGEPMLIEGGAGRDTFVCAVRSEGPTDTPYGLLMSVKDLITDFQSGQDRLDINELFETSEGSEFAQVTFGVLDSNRDGVFNGQDDAASITQGSFWGIKADSHYCHPGHRHFGGGGHHPLRGDEPHPGGHHRIALRSYWSPVVYL
jgi:hypothetical protein